MNVNKLLNRPATIIRRTDGEATDEYGNPLPGSEGVATVCEVQKQQRANEEPGDSGEVSDTRWVGFFPVGTELRTGDAVVVEGIGTLELVGDPWQVRNPRTQSFSHLEVPLRITKGAGE